MKIKQNLHIHSMHSCDSACAALNDIQQEMLALGMTEFGVSDHFHTRYNLCDIQSCRNDFLAYERPEAFHFGIEVSSVSKWECEKIAAGDYEIIKDDPVYGLRFTEGPAGAESCVDITREELKKLGVEYVIGGVHWPMYSPGGRETAYEDYFKQMMELIRNPVVDILAHPWGAIEHAAGDWFHHRDEAHKDYDAIVNIPEELNEKLCNELLKYDKCAEINLSDMLTRPDKCCRFYWEMFAKWREAGVKFTIGSDQHEAHVNRVMFKAAELLLDIYGFKDDDIRYFFNK